MTQLAQSCNANDRRLIVDTPPPAEGSLVQLEDEIVRFRYVGYSLALHDRDPLIWVVERGVDGTTAASHDSGKELVPVVPVYGVDPIANEITAPATGFATLRGTADGDDLGAVVYAAGGSADLTGQRGQAGVVGGDSSDGVSFGAQVIANGGQTGAHGGLDLQTLGSLGTNGQVMAKSGSSAWTDVLSSDAGVPGSSFVSLFYLDTTAVTGGLYAWDGSGYTKVGNVVS